MRIRILDLRIRKTDFDLLNFLDSNVIFFSMCLALNKLDYSWLILRRFELFSLLL